MLRTIVVLAALLVATPTAAYAQWTLKPFAGINFGSQHGFVDLDRAAGRVQPTFGAAAGWESSGAWGVEIELATSPNFFKGDSGLIETGRVDTLFANVSWRFGGSQSRFQPYVTGGLGIARATIEDALGAFSSSSNLAALNLGSGVIAGSSTRLRLVAEVRYVRSQYGDARPAALGEEYVAFWRACGGVLLRF
jgi:opacity protein-like surface antigen